MTSLPKSKLLLVEDSPVSQRVVTKQLKKLGYEVDLAGNGQEALDLMAQNDYGLVLLDCQMPILDGYQTIRAIRQQASPLREIIVIAMTAANNPEEQARCLQVGMNDYLHKPFSEDELAAKLNYWGQVPTMASQIHSAPERLASCATTTQTSTLLEGLTADVGVDLARFQQVTRGNVAFQKQVLQLFLQDTQKNLTLAKTAIAKADFAALEHQAHQIKGASANVGVKAIEVLAEQMEQYAHQQSLEAIADLITNIEKSLELIRSVALN